MSIYPSILNYQLGSLNKKKPKREVNKMACKKKTTKCATTKKCGTKEKCKKGGKK